MMEVWVMSGVFCGAAGVFFPQESAAARIEAISKLSVTFFMLSSRRPRFKHYTRTAA
jgi:hypothetical protein